MAENFARPIKELQDSGIPNASAPTAGMGLVLDTNGLLPASVLPAVSPWPSGVAAAGTEFVYEADSSNGVYWRFKYVPSQATYPWVFIGGSPLYSEITTDESTTSTSYAALSTAGPSVTLPRAGDYYVTIGTEAYLSSTGGVFCVMSYDIGGTGAVDADGISMQPTTTANTPVVAGLARVRRKTGLSAVTLTAKYKTGGGLNTAHFANRWMSVVPIRVS